MKHLSITVALLFLLSGVISAQNKDIEKKVRQRISKDCIGYNIDEDCLYDVLEEHKPSDRNKTFFKIPTSWKSKRSIDERNGYHVYATRYKGFKAYIEYCHQNQTDCYMIPEHPLIDEGTQMINTPDGFRFESVKEEPFNIEMGNYIRAKCDPNKPNSLCAQMDAMKNVSKMTDESREYRDDIKQCEYEWEHGLNGLVKIRSGELQSIETGYELLAQLDNQNEKLRRILGEYNLVKNRY